MSRLQQRRALPLPPQPHPTPSPTHWAEKAGEGREGEEVVVEDREEAPEGEEEYSVAFTGESALSEDDL